MQISLQPRNLSYIEAASILYAGLTAWSALWITGALCCKNTMTSRTNNKVLVLGGSGGVGTIAIQLLKAWNMHVIPIDIAIHDTNKTYISIYCKI